MARNDCSSSKISIWWDIENCHVPRNVDPHYIAQNLRSALHHVNLNGPITIDVFGDTRNLEHRILEALSSTGVTINHIPSGNKDAADKAILVAMLFWALDNPPPAHFLLISGDGDFANALHRLRLKGYDVLLARPDQQVKPALLGAATSVWYWTNVAKGHIPPPAEAKSAREDLSGTKARTSRVSIDEDAQNIGNRGIPVQPTNPGGMTSLQVSRTHDVKSETDNFSFGEQRFLTSGIEMLPTRSQISEHYINRHGFQENVKINGDIPQSESSVHAQRAKLVSHSPTLNTVNTTKQLYNLGQLSAPSGLGVTHVSKQSHDGYVSSNKITNFNTKGPPGISLPELSMTGHLHQGLSQDSQSAYNLNLLKVMKTFERLKIDGLVPTLDNLQSCLCYWEKQSKVNLKQVLDQAVNLGHVEKVSGDMGGGTLFLPNKTELWTCFNVHDMHYAFSDSLSKDFHQFLCCSKNWQFFVHSQSMYEAAQRLKKDGPNEIRDLAMGEIIHFLNQAIWKWKWLSLENTPAFLLSIKSQAVFGQSPIQKLECVPPKSSQPEKGVPPSAVNRHTDDSLHDTSKILKRLRSWLKETANSRLDYDVSLVLKDFQCETGIKLEIHKLGFSRLQELLEHFNDVVKIQVVRKGLKVLCPAVPAAQDKQQKGILFTSQDKQGILPSPQDSVQEKQGFTNSKEALISHGSVPSAIATSQFLGVPHVGETHVFSERSVAKNHPVVKKLRKWLLKLPSLKQGYDLSLIKRDFYQATSLVLDSTSLGHFKVKDIVCMFPEDFHVESPRPGLSLLFSNNKSMPAMKSNAGSNSHYTGGENLQHLVSDGTLSKLPQVKSKTASMQWKQLDSSVRTVDGKTSRVVETTKEAMVATITSSQFVYTESIPLNGDQISSNAEQRSKELDQSSGLTGHIG